MDDIMPIALGAAFNAHYTLRDERDALQAVLKRIASEPCDHGPMPFCPRELARDAIGNTAPNPSK